MKGFGKTQQETWSKHDNEVRRVLRLQGYKSYRELARKTRLDKKTVKRHINRMQESEFYEKKGRKFLKPPRRRVEEESNFPPEFDVLIRGINFPHTYRPGAREVGAVFLFAAPGLSQETRFFRVVEPYETEFLSSNPYWLRAFFADALREKLISEEYFSGKKEIEEIADEELDNLWQRLFGEVELFMVIFSLNIKKLLERLKTADGKADLRRALPNEVRMELYEEACRLWQQQKPLKERLKEWSARQRV